MRIGIIGSTGLKIDLFADRSQFETMAVGEKTFRYYHGYAGDHEIFMTARNQYNGSVPPHAVDYKLIMTGMKQLQLDAVVGTAVAGSLSLQITPGSYLVLDQFLDFTKKTPHTVYDDGEFAFVDFSEPFCPVIRKSLIQACEAAGVPFLPHGCYVGVDGPRYETNAESKMFAMLGGNVVGMTNVTETIFARELGMCYATLSVVSNYAAGIGPAREITRQDIYDQNIKNRDHTVEILKRFLSVYNGNEPCDCHKKNSDMLKSDPS